MKRTVYVLLLFAVGNIVLLSCDEETPSPENQTTFITKTAENVSFTEALVKGGLSIGVDEIFECGFVWSKTTNPTTTTAERKYFGPQSESKDLSFKLVGLSINTTYYFKTFIITSSGVLYGEELTFTTLAEIEWIEPGGFPGDARMAAISFVVGSKAYVGLGHGRDAQDQFAWYKDFWEFDMISNVWTKRKDYPGGGSSGAVAFEINGKGYVGTGVGADATGKDFWEYDPTTDSWTEKAEFIGDPVSYATGFALNGKGYIGTGVGVTGFLNSFYEYNPITNAWVQKADFPGLAVDQAIGFSIGDYGYIGMGLRHESWLGNTKQLWAYHPETDTWTQKKDCPSEQSLDGSVAFVKNSKAYVGLGWGGGNTIWRYNPELDDWQNDGEVVKSRICAIAIPLDNKVIIGVGASASSFYKDFEEYIPK